MGDSFDRLRAEGLRLAGAIREAEGELHRLMGEPGWDKSHHAHPWISSEARRVAAHLSALETQRRNLRAPVETELEQARRRVAEIRAREQTILERPAMLDRSHPGHEHERIAFSDAVAELTATEERIGELSTTVEQLGGSTP